MKSLSLFSNIKNGLNKNEFRDHLRAIGGYQGFEKEYNALLKDYTFDPKDIQTNLLPENYKKSRYSDIFCLDRTRVKLKDDGFIHANWVDGYERPSKFICSQGPMDTTLHDFYEMIEIQEIPIIVMTTKTVEKNQNKCHQYWPVKVNETLRVDNYEIRNLRTLSHDNCTIVTELSILNTTNSVKLLVTHIQFVSWPDHGVPKNSDQFNMLTEIVSNCDKKSNLSAKPILVHCSAGIGRSGAFIVVDIAKKMYEKMEIINILEVVKLLRSQRAHCVQTAEQYSFCCHVLDRYLNGTTI